MQNSKRNLTLKIALKWFKNSFEAKKIFDGWQNATDDYQKEAMAIFEVIQKYVATDQNILIDIGNYKKNLK